ncbi:MAG: hypothetical protein ACYC7E_21850 [Armatimonadota bacterium]
MTRKTFDCVEMKREVVYQAQQHVVGMGVTEKVAYYKAIGDHERAAQDAVRHRDRQDLPKTGTDD